MNLLQTKSIIFFLLLSCLTFAQSDADQQQVSGPISEIEFESTIFNYGLIESGEVVQTVFSFTNTSDEPLIIQNAKGSCGCTVPEWPKEAIRPGESGQFVVRFDSKNKVGVQSKRVTITANTEPALTYLTVKGEVIEATSSQAAANVLVETKVPKSELKDFDVADVLIYPNPVSEKLNVKLQNSESAANVYLYNSAGQLMDSQFTSSTSEVSFDVSQYSDGIYTVSIKSDNLHRIAKQVSIISN